MERKTHRNKDKQKMMLRTTNIDTGGEMGKNLERKSISLPPPPPHVPPRTYLMDPRSISKLKIAATRSEEGHVYDKLLEEDADFYQPQIPERNYDEADCKRLGVNASLQPAHTKETTKFERYCEYKEEDDDIYQPMIPERHYDESDCEGLGVNVFQPSRILPSYIDKEMSDNKKGSEVYMTLLNRDKEETRETHSEDDDYESMVSGNNIGSKSETYSEDDDYESMVSGNNIGSKSEIYSDDDYESMVSGNIVGSKSESIFNSIMSERRKVRTIGNTKEGSTVEKRRSSWMPESSKKIEQTSSSSSKNIKTNLYI